MACTTWEELLAAYSHEISVFTNAVRNMPGALIDDSRVITQELDRLSKKCRAANYALMAHLHRMTKAPRTAEGSLPGLVP